MALVKTAVAFVAPKMAKILLEKIVADLYEFLKGKGINTFKKAQIGQKATRLYSQLHKIQRVKTLWQVDKAVDIKSFYCDSHIVLDGVRKRITSIQDFGDRKNILIQGIAGQGKSILLRYLCSQCIKYGEFIPVFVELRKIQSNENLNDHVLRFLDTIGINIDKEILYEISKAGKIILFLDGFDEVAETDRQRLINEIEYLASSIDELMILVTARPESGFEMLTSFEVLRLDNLIGDEYKKVINKLSNSEKLSNSLIRQVESHKAQLRGLLCTPLMVTLLLMAYKSFQEIPAQLSDFYESIFQVLLQRHDGVKPGYNRPRRCKLNDQQYRYVFESFCFESRKSTLSVFTIDHVLSFSKKALIDFGFSDVDPLNYTKDIISVTCLLLKDGNDYRFIHKSVQEFYAATFIKRKAEPVAEKIYGEFLKQDYLQRWQQELLFLSEIDKYRYHKFFKLPMVLMVLDCKEEELIKEIPKVGIAETKKIFSGVSLGFDKVGDADYQLRSVSWPKKFDFINEIFKLNYSSVIEKLLKDESQISVNKTSQKDIHKGVGKKYIPVEFILINGLMLEDFNILAQNLTNEMYQNGRDSINFISSEESVEISLEQIKIS